MSDQTDLQSVQAFASTLSPWAHMATVGADGKPDVVPVHPCWGPALKSSGTDGETLWVMVGSDSVKSRNIAANPHVALHWQVTEVGDGVEIWGTAEVFDDNETKRALWEGVFDYDLNGFAPGGPDDSTGIGFAAVIPERALILKQYGMGGSQRWKAG